MTPARPASLSASTAATGSIETPHGRGGRPRRLLAALATVLGLALAALAAAALIPGSHVTDDATARHSVAHGSATANPLPRQHHVFDSRVSAARYGTEIARLENGVGADGLPASDLSPLPPRRFADAIAGFRHYAEGWAGRLAGASAALTAALRSGSRPRARAAWAVALSDYLHLGATYDLLPTALEHRIAEVPTSTDEHRFPGLHRIEQGLWTGAPLASLVGVSRAVQRAVATLPRALAHLTIDPTDYVRRTHEILEDAQRDLMSGAEVPWSGAGVLGTAAGVAATRELVATLAPLMRGRENTLGESRYWLARLGGALRAVRRPDGTYPPLGRLSIAQRERLDGALTGALAVLSQVPDTLETSLPRAIPRIPASGAQR